MGNTDDFHFLINNPEFAENIVYRRAIQETSAVFGTSPVYIEETLVTQLKKAGINCFYTHQVEAFEHINNHKNVVITTGTSSGKSLCYQLPILNALLQDNQATSLLLFPTKALTSDQYQKVSSLIPDEYIEKILPAVYDGDTPTSKRQLIRITSNLIFTNPDMLNIAILPHHTVWADLFRNLRFVVIDEIHVYKGIFGSHVANLIRRLRRVLEFYGADPVFIMTSATINNPKDHAERLIEAEVHYIHKDGSPHGNKELLLYNPPIINDELGIREGLTQTTEKFLSAFWFHQIQTIVFCRTRRFVEILLREMQSLYPQGKQKIKGYRSGYLNNERRDIETGLKSGEVLFAFATNALELGVDIGGVDAIIIPGYPGSISSFIQRSGRAGRKGLPSVTIFIASMNPLDQYLIKNPEYLLEKNPEEALIDPNNPLILISHLQCAASEIAFVKPVTFGKVDQRQVEGYLNYLCVNGMLYESNQKYNWTSSVYPAESISLRSVSPTTILLRTEKEVVGKVDFQSSLWMVHPGAIYLHGGETYLVESLDLERSIAHLREFFGDFLTEPVKISNIELVDEIESKQTRFCSLHKGEIKVTNIVTGYKRVNWNTREVLEFIELDMPTTELLTKSFWVSLNAECEKEMLTKGAWGLTRNDYGPDWKRIRDAIRFKDGYRCQLCGKMEISSEHHVHHKVPFKRFSTTEEANSLNNLVTLCPECHRLAEKQVKIRNTLSGLAYLLQNLSPLLVMCDDGDLGVYYESSVEFAGKRPTILLYDQVPGGMGLTYSLFEQFDDLLKRSLSLVKSCSCSTGCPSCIGPLVDESVNVKENVTSLLDLLMEN